MNDRIWAYINGAGFGVFEWQGGRTGATEYVRADIYYREFAKLEAVRAVIHRWIDSGEGNDLNNGGGMLEIFNILYASPAPTGDKKGTQP
jgi:hypothetical protein